ncbi:MAG TPA: superoxide dismutase family protein [Propionibacteriaceae bacterium]
MSRFRSIAVAALAVSALVLTPAAAYAHDDDAAGGGTVGGVAEPRMAWAHYHGELTDLLPGSDDVFDGAKATATMIGVDGSTFFRLRIRGIDEKAAEGHYGAHLHEGACVGGDGTAAGPHYNISPKDALGKPTLISEATEVWLDFEVNSDGTARSTARVPFVPLGGKRAIVLHAEPTAPGGTAGARVACLPLDIQTFPSTD